MIIENIEEFRSARVKDFKYYGKRVLIYVLLNNVLTILAALLFFYIEHCYDVIPITKSYRETKFLEMCNKTKSMNLTTNTSSPHIVLLGEIEQWCKADPTKEETIECVMKMETLVAWFTYVITIQYTIGNSSPFGFIYMRCMARN